MNQPFNMKPLGLVSQIFAVVLAVAIVVLFVRPTFIEIGELQSDIEDYRTERQRVSDINQQLADKVFVLESISQTDKARINTYAPSFLDEVQVLRDIENITNAAGVTYNVITYDGAYVDSSLDSNGFVDDQTVESFGFTVDVEGRYSNIKSFLSFLEQNVYPLQVYNLSVSTLEGSDMRLDATVVTHIDNQSIYE